MDKWTEFQWRHPPKDGFYLVSVRHIYWDKSAEVTSVSVKPFSTQNHVFYGFRSDPEWTYTVEAWMHLPTPYEKEQTHDS